MRQLKRRFTVLSEGPIGDPDAAPMTEFGMPKESPAKAISRPPQIETGDDPEIALPADETPRAVPKLELPVSSVKERRAEAARPSPPRRKETSNMDPPMLPPARKRASVVTRAGKPPPLPPSHSPKSPQRTLTPRVSWSDIVSHSQETADDLTPQSPPRTPVFRIRRPASPPQRSAFRRRPPSDDEGEGRDMNEGRFEREFCEVSAIGKGQFSTVYRARNRTDRCMYAVKKTTQIARGQRGTQLREVVHLATVSMQAATSQHIVRYYSSWIEDERLHIQTELCECSLRDRLTERRKQEPKDPRFGEPELVEVLRHVGSGLKVLHGCNLVHLDIKPDNVLISAPKDGRGCYKIADLGLAVAAMGCGCDDISEGDCRYLAKEVLRGDLSALPKADVFALGLVCYEMATNPRPLPCNGDEWHKLREDGLQVELMSDLSEGLLQLIVQMARRLPADRPQCEEILQHPSVLEPEEGHCTEELRALQERVRQQTLEAERNQQLAEKYWHEMMMMKRQELLAGHQVEPPPGIVRRYPATPQQPVLRRGRTS